MRTLKVAGLCLILLAGTVFIYVSFQPRMRFADPVPDEPLAVKRNYPCFHDRIYRGDSQADALFFGASKTHHALDPQLAEAAYQAVTGEEISVFVFDPAESNPDISYFIFRDYLANNSPPDVALFSLTWVGPRPLPVRYVHPHFADLAPAYLYLDVLKSWDLVHSSVFAVSDFLRLLVRHLDLSLSRLLVGDYRYAVPPEDNCPATAPAVLPSTAEALRFDSFAQLLDAELAMVRPNIDPSQVGTPQALLDTYSDNSPMTSAVENAVIRNSANEGTRHFWRRGGRATQYSLDYYQRIVALGRDHNVKVGFYFLPNILSPMPAPEEVEDIATALDAPVYVLPDGYRRVSYHHYRDPAHVTDAFTPVYSVWFASLINRIKDG